MESKRIIFLDIDGVLNCEVYYQDGPKENQICPKRVAMLNELCKKINAEVVISSSWRNNMPYCIESLKRSGATFNIIDRTPSCNFPGSIRGNEIYQWINQNSKKIAGVYSVNFKNYVIIDDDSDMLLWQKDHFFQTDSYGGLTPNICYKIERFFNQTKNIVTDEK